MSIGSYTDSNGIVHPIWEPTWEAVLATMSEAEDAIVTVPPDLGDAIWAQDHHQDSHHEDMLAVTIGATCVGLFALLTILAVLGIVA